MRSLLSKSLLSLSVLALLAAGAVGKTITIAVSSPKKSGDDIINIQYKDSANHTRTLSVTTGDPSNKDDDLTKGMPESEMATKYAASINAAAHKKDPDHPPVTAVSLGNHVTIAGANGNTLDKLSISSNTGQYVRQFLSLDSGTLAGLRSNPMLFAMVEFSGGIAGRNLDGNPSLFSVGTERYVATVPAGDFTRIRDVALALVSDLEAHGIRATTTADGKIILVVLDPKVDVYISAGTDDRVANSKVELTTL